MAFLKFTSCDNQVLVGCIPIAAVAVHLNLKSKIGQSSHKMYSNNIRNFQEFIKMLNNCAKISGNLLNAPCMSGVVCEWHWITLSFFHYIYIYMQISLNIIDILCRHIFFWIRSNSRITDPKENM